MTARPKSLRFKTEDKEIPESGGSISRKELETSIVAMSKYNGAKEEVPTFNGNYADWHG